MSKQPSDDQKLDSFLRDTSPEVAPDEIAKLDDGSDRKTSALDGMNRRRRRYDWVVSGPLFLIGGFFALRFLLAIVASSEPRNSAGFLDLGIAIFTLMIAFLVYTKYKQQRSE